MNKPIPGAFHDAKKAQTRGRLENGEMYFAGDWIGFRSCTYGDDYAELVNFEWDERAAFAWAKRQMENT